MLVIPGGHSKDTCDGVTRRDVLRVGSSALLGLSLPQMLRSDKASAAEEKYDAALNALADATHPGELGVDERHIAGLAASSYIEASTKFEAASQAHSAAALAAVRAQNAYEDFLGRPVEPEDWPKWWPLE